MGGGIPECLEPRGLWLPDRDVDLSLQVPFATSLTGQVGSLYGPLVISTIELSLLTYNLSSISA